MAVKQELKCSWLQIQGGTKPSQALLSSNDPKSIVYGFNTYGSSAVITKQPVSRFHSTDIYSKTRDTESFHANPKNSTVRQFVTKELRHAENKDGIATIACAVGLITSTILCCILPAGVCTGFCAKGCTLGLLSKGTASGSTGNTCLVGWGGALVCLSWSMCIGVYNLFTKCPQLLSLTHFEQDKKEELQKYAKEIIDTLNQLDSKYKNDYEKDVRCSLNPEHSLRDPVFIKELEQPISARSACEYINSEREHETLGITVTAESILAVDDYTEEQHREIVRLVKYFNELDTDNKYGSYTPDT